MTLTNSALDEEYKKAVGTGKTTGDGGVSYEKPVVGASVQNTQQTGNTVKMPEGYNGSTTVYGKASGTAQDIIDKMNQNSKAWYGADKATQDALHSENEYLSSMLGQYGVNSIGYDSGSGKWTGTALDESSLLPPYRAATLPSATNQSGAINNYYSAAQRAQLAALKNAYDQNILSTDAAAAKIPGIYQAAQNSAAAQSAVSQRNFNEYAAASGLNSGAGGQAQLAQNTALQSSLNSLETEKANALRDVETQRLSIQTEYQNAIAEAIANNELQKAQALYEEAVRVDESIVSTALNQASENYRAWSSRYQTSSDYISNQQTASANEYQKALTNAQTLASFGDFSGYSALGYTDEQIQQMYRIWAAQNPALAAAIGSTGYGGYSYGGGGGYSGGYTTTPYTPKTETQNTGTGGGTQSAGNGSGLTGGMTPTRETDTGTGGAFQNTNAAAAQYREIESMAASIANTQGSARAREYIDEAYGQGLINQYTYLMLKTRYA